MNFHAFVFTITKLKASAAVAVARSEFGGC